MIDKRKQGKKNRASGAAFERRVRDDLENLEEPWFVSKFQSNVDLTTKKFVPAKGNRFFARTLGFPDYICWMPQPCGYWVMGVECKINGYLTRAEKEKCNILLNLQVFDKILIAKKTKEKNRIKIIYTEFKGE